MGCFPCFGSSEKEEEGAKKNDVKDLKKDNSSSHHVSRVSSGKKKNRSFGGNYGIYMRLCRCPV